MIRLKLIVIMLTFLIIAFPSPSFSVEVNLPKTGQETCYDETGNVIDCANTGQDGDIQAGASWPSPHFEDNGNGTVTDRLTGLIWLKNANCGGTMNWNDALTYCNNLASGSCGLTDGSVAGDWRLPNIIELESLVNAEKSNPAAWLNTQGFTYVQSFYYWSASTYTSYTGRAWLVNMLYGYVFGDYKSCYYCYYYVWPVRAGQ